jgi:Domain of unknown function (DUF4412)
MNRATLGVALVSSATLSSLALAGTYVESTVTQSMGAQASAPQPMKMWFGGGKFRLEMQNAQQVQIFKDQTIYTLNVPKKSYSKLDKAAMDATLAQAKKATDDLYALLPPDQRAKMKKPETKPAMDRSVKPTTRTESAAGLSCKVWEVAVNGAKVRELCVVEFSALPNAKDYQATMKQVSDAFKDTPGAMEAWTDAQTMNGVPVITRMFLNGKLFQEVKTTSIRTAPTPDSMFVVPADYKEQKLSEMG